MACEARLTKILMAQYKNFISDPHPNLLAIMDNNNIRIWYFLICGLGEPFLSGEYIFKLTAPIDFPQSPPKFEFCTANGVFIPGGSICISVGEFHTNDQPGKSGSYGWRSALGMKGFAIQVVNGLICNECLESGIGIKILPDLLKIELAKSSQRNNLENYAELVQQFETIIAESPNIEPVKNIIKARNNNEMDKLIDSLLNY